MTGERSFDWARLLELLRRRSVIPVIGPELLLTPNSGQEDPLQRRLAKRLAENFDIGVANLQDGERQQYDEDPFNYVLDRCLEKGHHRDEIELCIRELIDAPDLPVPEPLRKLARIRTMSLYVSLTFDSLLSRALNEERFNGRDETRVLAYAPNLVEDLSPKEADDLPTVYHLFGKKSPCLPYVITKEDTLEFFCKLSERVTRPKRLFQRLAENNLLILGCSFPDWLARFFMRIAKGMPLSTRQSFEFLADRKLHLDKDLVLFLHYVSRRTEIYHCGGAVEFVNELYQRYEQAPWASRPVPAPGEEEQPKSVFLSYAREDQAAARRIRAALEAAKLNVWFDKGKLEGGDEWERKIKRAIDECALFVPLVSVQTERRTVGFFRREWRWALTRDQDFTGATVPFMIPVTIDETRPDTAAQVPDEFKKYQWEKLPGGQITPEFVDSVRNRVRECRKREQARE